MERSTKQNINDNNALVSDFIQKVAELPTNRKYMWSRFAIVISVGSFKKDEQINIIIWLRVTFIKREKKSI